MAVWFLLSQGRAEVGDEEGASSQIVSFVKFCIFFFWIVKQQVDFIEFRL